MIERVSVVMPTHNRATTLVPSMACVLAQPVELELVVVDDGSTDDTAVVVGQFQDHRVRYVRQDHAGLCAARNTGLAAAHHPWVAFVDDDDLWAPTKLTTQLAALAGAPPARWCIASVVIADDDLNPVLLQAAPPPHAVGPRLRRENCVPGGGSGVLVETALLRALGGFDESLRHLGDWELWLRLAAVSAPAVVTDPQLVYRRHRGQMSAGLDEIAGEIEELARRGLVDEEGVMGRPVVRRGTSGPASTTTARLLGRALLAHQEAAGRAGAWASAERVVAAVRPYVDG